MICKTVLVNSVLFFPACYACACETAVVENSSNPFSYVRKPPRVLKNGESKDRFISVEIGFQISRPLIRISKIQIQIQIQISQSNASFHMYV